MKLPGKAGVLYLWSRNSNEPMAAAGEAPSEADGATYVVAEPATGKLWMCDLGATDGGLAYVPTAQLRASRFTDQQHEGRVHYVFVNFRGTQRGRFSLRYDNSTSDDVTLPMGEQQPTVRLQQVKRKIYNQSQFGKFVSARIELPPGDGPDGALYSVRLDARLRSRRVWRSGA